MSEDIQKKNKGAIHPVSAMIAQTARIFSEIGFQIAKGPEIETEFYNFDALNIPGDHPARDMWDTFWLKDKNKNNERLLLRTHTSPVQIRYMTSHKPPIKIIAPGKTFRHEATDATHEAQFFQIEGLQIDEHTSMADLKGTIDYYLTSLFGPGTKTRFRPSFFPFVEPGVEIDVWFNGKWLEVMGAGMVHPKVLEACNIDSKKYKGFAFGGGIDRFVMIKHGIDDIRSLYNGDVRVTSQFEI